MTALAEAIKRRAVERLDREAKVHRSSHQNVHARRYVVPRPGGADIEVALIVKGSNLQIWCEATALDGPAGLSLSGEFRAGGETDAHLGPSGTIVYGRHSSLRTMDRLRRGDAWRFVPRTVGDLDRILDAIKGEPASASPLV